MSSVDIEIRGLEVGFGSVRAVRSVDLRVPAGEVTVVVGESGCGKSTLLRAILGLLPAQASVSGTIRLGDLDMADLRERDRRRLRGSRMGYVPQNPFVGLDPLRRVGAHLRDAARAHGVRLSAGEIKERFAAVGIADAYADGRAYPGQWSGGMLQRACIAAATLHDPPILLADEPTSALDRDAQDLVLASLLGAQRTLLLVTHDFRVAERIAHQIVVMYHGRIVEIGLAEPTATQPRHPYTRALHASVPRGRELPMGLDGAPPSLASADAGCSFAPRCAEARTECSVRVPELIDGVWCHYPLTAGGPR